MLYILSLPSFSWQLVMVILKGNPVKPSLTVWLDVGRKVLEGVPGGEKRTANLIRMMGLE